MDIITFTVEEVRKCINKMKMGKQADLDRVKTEIFRWINESQV